MNLILFLQIMLLWKTVFVSGEPHCSRFHYEEKLLEKMIRMEIRMEEIERKLHAVVEKHGFLAQDMKEPCEKQPRSEVAFSANAGDEDAAKTENGNIIFKTVLLNIGNAYNEKSGEFVAPSPGAYYFFCSALSSYGAEFWVHLTVNGSLTASLNERGTNRRHGMASQAFVIQLNVGDTVTVKTNEKLYGNTYTTFSGFLLN